MNNTLAVSPFSGPSRYGLPYETVHLAFSPDDYLHISIDRSRSARVFGNYARCFGYDPKMAISFFEEKVKFQLGKVGKLRIPEANSFDTVLNRVIGKIQGGTLLGLVVSHNDTYTLRIDAQAIAKHVGALSAHSLQDNHKVTVEENIADIKRAVDAITEHELYHLIQYIADSSEMEKTNREAALSLRLLFAYAATTFAAASLNPRQSELPIIMTSPLVLGATAYLNQGSVKVTHDSYEIRKKTLKLNFQSPYEFFHEKILRKKRFEGDDPMKGGDST